MENDLQTGNPILITAVYLNYRHGATHGFPSAKIGGKRPISTAEAEISLRSYLFGAENIPRV